MADDFNPDELSRLLPFYLNGTLPQSEQVRIETALSASADLREQLDEHRRLAALIKAGGQQWADGDVPDAPDVVTTAFPVKAASPLAFLSPVNWNPAISLALALAVGAQTAALVWQHRTIGELREENYQLASGKDPAPTAGSILIEIKDGAAWNDVAALLDAEGLRIVSGGDFGALVLHSDKQGQELEKVIVRLKASPLIASADPAA